MDPMDARLIKNLFAWFLWLLLIIIWNYGYPLASPAEDVLVSIALAMILRILQRTLMK